MGVRRGGQQSAAFFPGNGCGHRPPEGAVNIEPGVFFHEATQELWVSLYGYLGERGVQFAKELAAYGVSGTVLLIAVGEVALTRFKEAFPKEMVGECGVTTCGHPEGGDS